MTASPPWLTPIDDGVRIAVKLTPRARVNSLDPVHSSDPELKIRLTAPPVDNAANRALVQFLAKTFHCAAGRVRLVQGHKSRRKIVEIHGIGPANVLERIVGSE